MYKKNRYKFHWNTKDTNVYIFEIEGLLKDKQFVNDIIERYRTMLDKINAPKKRDEFIATRVAHHHILKSEFNIDYENSAPFYSKESGMSISHSGQHLALAYSKFQIGIDLEVKSDRIEKIRSKILHPEEDKTYDALLSPYEKHLYLNRIWTTKEACYKGCLTNFYSFKSYKTENLLGKNPTCEILNTKEKFELHFIELEKFYFCLAILS